MGQQFGTSCGCPGGSRHPDNDVSAQTVRAERVLTSEDGERIRARLRQLEVENAQLGSENSKLRQEVSLVARQREQWKLAASESQAPPSPISAASILQSPARRTSSPDRPSCVPALVLTPKSGGPGVLVGDVAHIVSDSAPTSPTSSSVGVTSPRPGGSNIQEGGAADVKGAIADSADLDHPHMSDVDADGSHASNKAQAALDMVRHGCDCLAQLEFPAGAAVVCRHLRENVDELQTFVGDAKDPIVTYWPRPSLEEQAEWEGICDGGTLFWSTVCVASEDIAASSECFVGRLFVSSIGILFDGGLGWSQDEETLSTELIPWDAVSSIQVREGNARPITPGTTSAPGKLPIEAVLALDGSPMQASRELRLQLSRSRDAWSFKETWLQCVDGLLTGRGRCESVGTFYSIAEEDGLSFLDFSPVSARSPASTSRRHLTISQGTTPRSSHQALRKRMMTGTPVTSLHHGSFEESMMQEAAAMLPDPALFSSKGPRMQERPAPVCEMRIPHLTVSDVLAALLKDGWPVHRFLREALDAHDISSTPWVDGQRGKGKVRQVHFMMPLRDAPAAVRALVSIPESSKMTMISRLRSSDDEVVLVQHTCTHDVMYGEHFRTQETLSFRPHPDGGVLLTKWAEIVWVKPLSWTLGAFKAFVEKKAWASAPVTAEVFARVLEGSHGGQP